MKDGRWPEKLLALVTTPWLSDVAVVSQVGIHEEHVNTESLCIPNNIMVLYFQQGIDDLIES